jgi:VIT1/CCC1 family predicted Fe2+/Mn2+ transporter
MNLLQDPFIVKNLTFGIEDSLISTTGVLVGIAAAKFRRREILIAGLILITVEALSMTYGVFLSDENFLKASDKPYSTSQIMKYSLAMFLSYFLIGLILLVPYAANLPHPSVITVFIAMSILMLLILKYEKSTKRVVILLTVGAILMTVSIVLGKHM